MSVVSGVFGTEIPIGPFRRPGAAWGPLSGLRRCCFRARGRLAGAEGGEAGVATAEPEAGGLLEGVADGGWIAVAAVAVDAQGGFAGAVAVLEGEGGLVVAAMTDGGRCTVPAAGSGMGAGQPGGYLGGGCNGDAVCVCVHMCYIAGEITRVSCGDWAPFRRQPERGFSFCLWANVVQGPGSFPGRLLPGFPVLYPGGRVQERVAHEVGEALFAGFGGGDDAAFVTGGYADRDLGRFSEVGGISDSWILCGLGIGRVTPGLHECSPFGVSAYEVRDA